MKDYFEIGAFLDGGFRQQVALDLDALERAIGRQLTDDQRQQFLEVQHRAMRWTFLGSAMGNRNFLAVLAGLSQEAASQVETAAKSFSLH
jgi:hypothetical protein